MNNQTLIYNYKLQYETQKPHVCRFWEKTVCLLHTQHTLDSGLCLVQQIWFEILLFRWQKVHFWILHSFLPLVFFILASFSDITKNHNWWHIEDIDCQEVRRRWHIWTRLKQWYNWTHGVPVSLHSLYWLTNGSLYSYSYYYSSCTFRHLWYHSFIHSVVCLTTGPKPLPKRALHIVRSTASSFNWEYHLLSLRSSSSFLHLLPRLPVTSILPFIFPSITRCRRQFLRKMWPIQLAFLLLISCRIFLCSLTLSNTSSFLTWSVQLIFSILLQRLWFMIGIISIKIKNTRNCVKVVSSSADESAVE